ARFLGGFRGTAAAPALGAWHPGDGMRAREDRVMPSRYQPIENYGIIGNMRTAALVGMDGSIDWCCLPHFDSPSVFAAILDDHKGGFWSLAPVGESQVKQMYMPDTNVLLTRFFSDAGMSEVIDFMPVGREAVGQTEQESRQIVRI